jgi:hypothetical protein
MSDFYYHGGRPGLRVGDVITAELGGRPIHDGCPYCEDRDREAHGGEKGLIDHLPAQKDRVYATPVRLYAKYYASLWGRGDLYRVSPVGEPVRSDEDTFPAFHAEGWRIESVYERAVLLTWTERRRLYREWGEANIAHQLSGGEGA